MELRHQLTSNFYKPALRQLKKRVCEIQVFFTVGGWNANLNKIPFLRPQCANVISVSDEKLHEFDIICPARSQPHARSHLVYEPTASRLFLFESLTFHCLNIRSTLILLEPMEESRREVWDLWRSLPGPT